MSLLRFKSHGGGHSSSVNQFVKLPTLTYPNKHCNLRDLMAPTPRAQILSRGGSHKYRIVTIQVRTLSALELRLEVEAENMMQITHTQASLIPVDGGKVENGATA